MKAVSCLVPTSSGFLDATLLSPLHLLAGTADSVSHLEDEIIIAKTMLAKKKQLVNQTCQLCANTCKFTEAFPELHQLYVNALVIGVSSASSESSFSTLSRVLTPFRRCMSHPRKTHLVILAYEKSIISSLDMD